MYKLVIEKGTSKYIGRTQGPPKERSRNIVQLDKVWFSKHPLGVGPRS